MSEIVLSRLKMRISAHCNEFPQNRWIFAILPNTGGSKYFPHKCGGFLELTRAKDPLGFLLEDRPTHVQDLIQPGGSAWNEIELRKHLVSAEDVLQTPIGRLGSSDFMAWNYTKIGIFSVRSVYHLAIQNKRNATCRVGSSRSCEEHKGWLAL
jgi:hypothetical protein